MRKLTHTKLKWLVQAHVRLSGGKEWPLTHNSVGSPCSPFWIELQCLPDFLPTSASYSDLSPCSNRKDSSKHEIQSYSLLLFCYTWKEASLMLDSSFFNKESQDKDVSSDLPLFYNSLVYELPFFVYHKWLCNDMLVLCHSNVPNCQPIRHHPIFFS